MFFFIMDSDSMVDYCGYNGRCFGLSYYYFFFCFCIKFFDFF